MKFATIVQKAKEVSIELVTEVDIVKAATDVTPTEIVNARSSFQRLLAENVDLLGPLPKTKEELAITEVPDDVVAGFVASVHAAALAEARVANSNVGTVAYGTHLRRAADSFQSQMNFALGRGGQTRK